MDKIIHTTITELLGTLLKEKILTAEEAAKYLVAYDSLFEYVEKVEKNIDGSIEIVASSVEEMTAYTQLIITMNATDSDCKSIW